jgi:hypothetical protein
MNETHADPMPFFGFPPGYLFTAFHSPDNPAKIAPGLLLKPDGPTVPESNVPDQPAKFSPACAKIGSPATFMA